MKRIVSFSWAAIILIIIILSQVHPGIITEHQDEKADVDIIKDEKTNRLNGPTRGGLRIAVEQPAASNGGAPAVVNQLNDDTYFDFTAQRVVGGDINTVAKLNDYNAVVIGQSGSGSANSRDFHLFGAALKNWVWNGGGVVSTGFVVYANPGADIDAVVPVRANGGYYYYSGGNAVITDNNHPVTTGINNFNLGGNGEGPNNGIDPGARIVGTHNGRPQFVVAEYGEGRIVYLGPAYMGGAGYNHGFTDYYAGAPDRLMEQAVAWAAGISLPDADDVAIKGAEDDSPDCYARYKPYTVSVNISSREILNDVSEVRLHLDYNTTNATLCYNWTENEFFKLQDPGKHVWLLTDDCTVTHNSVDMWWLNFSVIFNFSFPHENLVDCFVNTTARSGEISIDRFPYVFRVENDLEFAGTPDFTANVQGILYKGNWIKGAEEISLRNLTVRYADTTGIYPDDQYFDVKVSDSTGNTWWDNESKGEKIEINITSRNVTDPDEEYLITIENIPGSGLCMTNLSFPLKIDADPPLDPLNLVCHADGFKDKETENTDQALMYVTWDAVEDPASGLLGYYYSAVDNSGTENGTFINVTEVQLDELPEGQIPIYVWCVDNVGNIGKAAGSGILVDLTSPIFSNHTPLDGLWHNHTDIDCSIEINDGEGSGIDGSTIEYSVSTGVGLGFDLWIPAWVPEEGNIIIPSVKYIFPEGEENYIKWRAKDIAGNGFSESSPVNIKVDVTPVNFAAVISPQTDWYDDHTITTKITVNDAGSGVDPSRLEVRVSTSGSSDFGRWMQIDPENISESGQDGYEITVTFTYAEGKDNYIMFRGTDMVGNPFTLSDKFNFKIDTSPVYFGSFTPAEEEYADQKKVECFIQIFDDGSGVDTSTVEYSIATGVGDTGVGGDEGRDVGGDEIRFGPWKKVVNVVGGNPAQVLLEVDFDWGKDNFIKWRADDLMGTGFNESMPYRVWVNSRPEVRISSPDPAAYFGFDSEITFDASGSLDEDGDNLSFYWSSNVSANRSLGSGAVINAKLVPGKHAITVFATDGHGYNESKKVRIEVGEETDFERDSDGDGFSDSLEREKGTDPHNAADFPGGEPDIVDTESGGILGGGSSMLFVIIGGIILLIIVVLVILFIVRKRKKPEENKISPPIQPTLQRSQYGPPQHPYPQGQYYPGWQQGYGGTPQFQPPYGGMTGGSPQVPMLPPGPGMPSAQQFGTAAPGQAQQPQVPQYNQSQQPTPYGQAAPPSDLAAPMPYSLPQFSTEQGPQNLERMALPPGPAPSDQEMMDPVTHTQITSTDVHDPSATLPDVGVMETIFQAPPEPVLQTGEVPQAPPVHDPVPPQSPPVVEPGAPPVDSLQTNDLTELDSYLSSLDELSKPPEPAPPAAPPVAPPVPGESPAPMTNETTMQCHSCGNNYTAVIVQLPALVTCPVCQTQGVIESL